MSRLLLYQCTQAEVISSRSVRVARGPRRNGAIARALGFVQADGLGECVVESPAVPMEVISPSTRRVSPKCTAVHCSPHLELDIRGGPWGTALSRHLQL
jgi:hypothetical protein